MESLKQITIAARDIWERWTVSQRILVVTAGALSLLTVVGVGIWSTRPEMVVLASRLPPEEANEVIAQLEAAGVAYDLSYSGSTISVPRKDMNRARLAVRQTLGDQSGVDALEDSIWADPSLQHVRIQHQREQRLASSIARFSSVRAAVVHISAPQPTPFVRNQTAVTASVVIELAPGAVFSGQDAAAVVSLVSHGVEGLRPEDVTLMDTNGRLLSSHRDGRGDVSGQLEYVSSLENHLASKAETLLSQMLGPGRAMVRVTADVDFTQLERQETTYDPSTKVKLSETIKSESHSGPNVGSSGGGVAGSGSNLNPGSGGASGGGTRIEENTTEYANTEIRDTIKESPGRIKRLTVAAIVDLNADEGETAPAVTTAEIESLIKQAVGFDSERSDEINVVSAALAGAPDFSLPPIPVWEQYGPLVRHVSLAVAAVVMLVLGMLLLRRLKPVVVQAADADATADSIRRLAELSLRARQHPELVAKVLETWLEEDAAPPVAAGNVKSPAGRRAAA